MSTSPQSSAQQYLIRARAEAHWNRRRAGVKSGTSLPVNKCTSQDEFDRAWEEALRAEPFTSPETDAPIQAALWYCGNPLGEAREFLKLLQRGVCDLEKLRSDIGISVSEMADLSAWIAWKPSLESRIRRMIVYREKVLAAFNALVESDAALTTPQTARQPISNSL